MSQLANHSSVDENIAMFLQYGLSEDSTINDDVIAQEIQQQYKNNLIYNDAAIALEIQKQEETYLHDDEGLARTLQDMEANTIDEDIPVNNSDIGRHAHSFSRTYLQYDDDDHFSNHYTHTRTPSNMSSISAQSVPVDENIDPAIMTYEELNELEESIGDVGRGLSQERISKLPNHKYGVKTKTWWWQTKKNKFVATDTQCSICLVDYEIGDKITTLQCKHIYHKDCISEWLNQNKVCCICKAEV